MEKSPGMKGVDAFSLVFIDNTAQKMKFSIKDFFSKCDQIQIWWHLLMKSLMENFTFCAVQFVLFNKKPELMIKKEKKLRWS